MKAKQIVETLKTRKGQHVSVTWCRPMKTRADVTATVQKCTTAYVRAGIDYANTAAVREGIASGEREAVRPLSWGEWSEFPFIISHKGNDYVRLYPATFGNLKPSVGYLLNGQPASSEDVKPLCLASEFRESDSPAECFTLKAETIVSIGE